jgi:hypothetical protein
MAQVVASQQILLGRYVDAEALHQRRIVRSCHHSFRPLLPVSADGVSGGRRRRFLFGLCLHVSCGGDNTGSQLYFQLQRRWRRIPRR